MFKKLLYELYMTFSEQPSVLSSKKIERCVVFISMLLATYIYVYKNIDKLDATSFMIIVAGWMGYGAYNTLMVSSDRKMDLNNEIK